MSVNGEKVINRDTLASETGKVRSLPVPGTIEQPIITEKAAYTYVYRSCSDATRSHIIEPWSTFLRCLLLNYAILTDVHISFFYYSRNPFYFPPCVVACSELINVPTHGDSQNHSNAYTCLWIYRVYYMKYFEILLVLRPRPGYHDSIDIT